MVVDVEIEQLRTGDRTAWDRAFTILKAISLSVCCSTAPDLNHHDHEDVAIAAITAVVKYVKEGKSFEECKKLVVTISKNRLNDRFSHDSTEKRRNDLGESLEAKEGFDAADPAQELPDVAAMKGERAAMVREALKQIPEKSRKILEDSFFNDLTQQEIADRHGLNLKTIGATKDRGLQALAKVLKKKQFML
ncbi:MAG: sigma-70 family RNA polymerase sigma factor [Acidobacteriia bacterium]|nr:sigma-70 family RNA polymerase sigma factor [Terriglobia bacterium]